MPELPEVQTTVDYIGRHINGRAIANAWMDPLKSINTGSNLSWFGIRKNIIGRRITDVSRRAKFIVIKFDNGAALWVHQKMTGHLLIGQWNRKGSAFKCLDKGPVADDPANRFIRMLISLDSGPQLALSDARRFARVIFVRNEAEISKIGEIAKLGPEPLSLGLQDFAALFNKKRGTIKSTLMDPAFVVGIGNIYADEILHKSGIHPFSRIETLDKTSVDRIYRNMKVILNKAIAAGGSSTDNYRTPEGIRGKYQNQHRAYGKEGSRCSLCAKGKIERVMRNGRSSHFCSTHQLLT
jgi:formamidopyrimidine-DNA glycosylase